MNGNGKKRGLGRGLEVLLADTTSPAQQPNPETNNYQLAEQLLEEQICLLQEAENLKQLLDELAQMLRSSQH